MRILWPLILSLLLGSGALRAVTIDPFPRGGTLTDIFNANCLQMTQSQQMLKAYIMHGLGSKFDEPLDSAVSAYDQRFRKIMAYFTGRLGQQHPEAVAAFEKAQRIWLESKEILLRPPTRRGAMKLKTNFSAMIPLLLEGSKPAADNGLELLSLTGKLCRGPMKISIDYLLKLWGVRIPHYAYEVEKIIDDFHRNLAKLRRDPRNNRRTEKLLEQARKDFLFFEMMYNVKTRYIPHLLSRKADDNFKIIRAIKAEYKKRLP